MPSKKPQQSKKAVELTTEEAVQMLFPSTVIEHAKDRAVEADRVLPKRRKKSMTED